MLTCRGLRLGEVRGTLFMPPPARGWDKGMTGYDSLFMALNSNACFCKLNEDEWVFFFFGVYTPFPQRDP